MKTSTKSMVLLSALAIWLSIISSAFGQSTASSPGNATSSVGYPGRTHSHVDPALLETEREAWEAIAQGEAVLKKGNALGLPQVNALLDAQEAAMQAEKAQAEKAQAAGK